MRLCIDKLTPPHARAIRLAFYEDMGYAEIAGVEQVPEGTVKTRIRLGMNRLRASLGEAGTEWP